jgi:hypothetical protein
MSAIDKAGRAREPALPPQEVLDRFGVEIAEELPRVPVCFDYYVCQSSDKLKEGNLCGVFKGWELRCAGNMQARCRRHYIVVPSICKVKP